MSNCLIDEKTLTSFANGTRGLYNKHKDEKMTGQQIVDHITEASKAVVEQHDIIDKIYRKLFIIDEDVYLEGTMTSLYNTTITRIRHDAFIYYHSLNSIDCPNVTSIGYRAFQYCDGLTSVKLPKVTSIGSSAFESCDNLISMDLPALTSMESYVFLRCSNLASINIPLATSIDYRAFGDCSSLTFIDLPSITFIGQRCFDNCTSLTTVIIRSNTLCITVDNPFIDTPIANGTGYIYVPRVLIEDYKVANYWSVYANQFRAIEDYPEICETGGNI